MSEILSENSEQNSEFGRWNNVLNPPENKEEGSDTEQKARALFEADYNGEKEFGPQGLVDYWTRLKEDYVGRQISLRDSPTLDPSQVDVSRRQSDEDDRKMRTVREYLEMVVWGDELAKSQTFKLTWNKNNIEPILSSGVSAEALYSRVLMGERNVIWTDGDLEYNKYGSGMEGTASVNDAGYDILASADFLPLMEAHGVDIDGNDILARTQDLGIIAENVGTLCRLGVDIDVLMEKIQDSPYTLARNLDALLSAGAKIDINGLVSSLNARQKVYCIEGLCRHGAKIDISKLIESAWQEAEQNDVNNDKRDLYADSRHTLVGDLMGEAGAIIKYGGRNAVDVLRNKLKTLNLGDKEAELLAKIPDERTDEFGLSGEDMERRRRKWEEYNITAADKEAVRDSNFNNVDIGLDLNKPASPDVEDKINCLLKVFCNLDSSGCIWDNSNLSERKRICTEIAGFLRGRLGITMDARIVFSELEDNVGGHMGSAKDGGGLETAINSKHLEKMTGLEAIEIISHETWHFYQIQCAYSSPQSNIGRIYKKNLDQYIRMADDYDKYMEQPLEEEAYRFGRMFMDYVKKLEMKLNNEEN